MQYIKLKNTKTGLFCDGSGTFDFNSNGRVFTSIHQLNRYMRTQLQFNKTAVEACKDDIEVVEYDLIPQKSTHLNINNLNNLR